MRKKLKELKKGDTVYFSIYGYESKEVKVKKVKLVDKAVLITIEPSRPMHYGTFFTGYYTSDIALGLEDGVIRTSNWALDKIRKLMDKTDKADMKNYEAARVIKAIKDIKDYLIDNDKCCE